MKSFGKILSFSIVGILLTMAGLHTHAEGTKQFRPDSTIRSDLWISNGIATGYTCFATVNCDPDQRLYVHISHPGEKVYMGFNCPGTASFNLSIRKGNLPVYSKVVTQTPGNPGFLEYHSQALAGPNVLDPHGYVPLVVSFTAAGDYSIGFVLPTTAAPIGVTLFDVTVIDTTILPFHAIDGRLYSKDWGCNTHEYWLPGNSCIAKQYIYTDDSIVTSLNYNNMQGWNFDITSTKNGCYPSPYPWDSSCLSRLGNYHYAQYKIFLNDPDSVVYPTGTFGHILGDSVHVSPHCDGTFDFDFRVSKSGSVILSIESDLSPGIQQEDLTMSFDVVAGLNSIRWNGKNGLGKITPCGDSVFFSIKYINGLTNVALYDVERHYNGFIIESVRPGRGPVTTYWNDILLDSLGGEPQLTGCNPVLPDSGCHRWGFGTLYLGSHCTINTWWYAPTSVLDIGKFRINCVPVTPEGIDGNVISCTAYPSTFTVIPGYIGGTDVYEWVLKDYLSAAQLLDTLCGSSLTLDFSWYPPGKKILQVRATNFLCGSTPFMPVPGLIIEEYASPAITNTIKNFTICSGDTTEISLQSDMTGTTYSWVATGSPVVSGFSSGSGNQINQKLFYTGVSAGHAFYDVIPYNPPCPGDTVRFVVNVLPTGSDTLQLPVICSADTICSGDTLFLYADSAVSGSSAVYNWFVNGILQSFNGPCLRIVPAEHDRIRCLIYSSLFCNSAQVAASQFVDVQVNQRKSVSVLLHPDPLCPGDSAQLVAVPVNGGLFPLFQWFVNSVPQSASGSSFSFLPVSGDVVSVKLTSSENCVFDNAAQDSINIKNDHKLIDTTVCYGEAFYAGGSWQHDAGIYYDTIANPTDCIKFLETHLSYKSKIEVDLGSDTTLCEGSITLHVFLSGAVYRWQDGSSSGEFLADKPGEYSVTVTSEGCSVSDTITIEGCSAVLYFPSAFTPNNDGLNDYYRPLGQGIESFSIIIFSRWGTKLYESTDINEGWNGKFRNSDCPEGTYLYHCQYSGQAGETKSFAGSFILKRNN